MEVFHNIEDVRRDCNSVLTVGTFDGVHLGHQFILKKMLERAQFLSAQTTVVTFDPHPRAVLRQGNGGDSLKLLTAIEERLELLEKYGVDRVVVIGFTKDFAKTSSREFVSDYLYQRIGFRELVIGHDHGFGSNREGDIETLKVLAEEMDFGLHEIPEYKTESQSCKSSSIRKFLSKGKVNEASHSLGRLYEVRGLVIQGDGRGRRLNFPTANIAVTPESKLIPANGVYAVYAWVQGTRYKGMMNIGMRPTFSGQEWAAEVHLFDFGNELYGEEIRVEFMERIRAEEKFSGPDELSAQLQKDKAFSLQLLD